MTQAQLAARTHFSESLVKKVEQGSTPPSAAVVAAIARAMAVQPAQLYGTAEPEPPEQPQLAVAVVPELRAALEAHDDPRPEGDLLPLDEVRHRLQRAARAVYGLRYVEAGRELPNLLQHLFVLDRSAVQGEPVRAVLHDAYRLTSTVAGRLRQQDLAAIATERHQRLAPETGDPLRVAISAYHRSTHHLQYGTYDAGLRVLERASQLTDETPAGRAVAIQLYLRSAVIAARNAGPDRADEYVAAARGIAAEYHPPATPYYNVNADPLNIAVHWCAVPVENGDGTESVRRADQLRIGGNAAASQPERVGHHHIDMARAWLLHGDRDRVIEHLNAARRVAPHNTRYHPAVRETVYALVESDRRRTESLSGFARWAGIRF